MIHRNSNKQGDAGLGACIAHFTSLGYGVSIPLTDSQQYDLVVDDGDHLYRVQVKTTRYKSNGKYRVELRTKGGNKTGTGKIKFLPVDDLDFLFVLTAEEHRYLIPVDSLPGRGRLTLGDRCDEFLV